MSVLIKGMDIPKNCTLCFLRDDFHNYCPYEENKETDCPLVEVEECIAFSNFDDKERMVYVSVD